MRKKLYALTILRILLRVLVHIPLTLWAIRVERVLPPVLTSSFIRVTIWFWVGVGMVVYFGRVVPVEWVVVRTLLVEVNLMAVMILLTRAGPCDLKAATG